MQKNGLTAERTESSIRTHKGFLRERKALLSHHGSDAAIIWLKYLLALISEDVNLRERSRRLREQSAAIRREARAVRARSAGPVYSGDSGNKTFIVTMNPRPAGAYSVIAERVEIHGEHLVLVRSAARWRPCSSSEPSRFGPLRFHKYRTRAETALWSVPSSCLKDQLEAVQRLCNTGSAMDRAADTKTNTRHPGGARSLTRKAKLSGLLLLK
jgi:hypothetical protein